MLETKNVMVVAGILVLLLIGGFIGYNIGGGDNVTGASGAPITTDLRNNVYIDGVTIRTTPESAMIFRIANFLVTGSAASSTIDGTLTIGAATTISGDLTTASSYDGFTVGGGVTPSNVATGTKLTVYTHTGSPVVCNSLTAVLYSNSTGYSPSLQVSVGLATDVDLVSTTTIATTTDSLKAAATLRTVVNAGDTIDIYFADGEGAGNTEASTTNLANWDVEFQMADCWLIGG